MSRSSILQWLTLAAILTCFTLSVFADGKADPPLGPNDLEGQWLLEARARVDQSPLGNWRPGLLIPAQTLILQQCFEAFGTSLTVARVVSGIAAVLSLALFFWLVRKASSGWVALAATVLLAVNPSFFGLARTAMPASLSLLFILISIWVWIQSQRSLWLAFVSGVLVVFSGLVENGPSSLFFLAAAVLMLGMLRLHAWRMPWIFAARARMTWILIGAIAAMGFELWLIVGNWSSVGLMWSHLMRFSLRMMVTDLVLAPTYIARLFANMPVVTLMAVFSFLFYAKESVRPVFRHRPLNEYRLWFLCWLMAGGIYALISNSPSLADLVLIVPPLCAVAADGLFRIVGFRGVARPKVDVLIVMTLIGGAVWFLAAWVVQRYYNELALPNYFEIHRIRGVSLLVFAIWVPLTLVLTWVYVLWGQFGVRLARWQVVAIAVVCLGASVGRGIVLNLQWYEGRTYQLAQAKQVTASLSESHLVVGSWAPLVTLGQSPRAAIIWPHINSYGVDWYGEVTHLLLDAAGESRQDRPPVSLFLNRDPSPVSERAAVGPRNIRLYALSPVNHRN